MKEPKRGTLLLLSTIPSGGGGIDGAGVLPGPDPATDDSDQDAGVIQSGPETEPAEPAGFVRFDDVRLTKRPAGLPRHMYTGREWDNETGQYYYRARYYDAKTGRFLSEDPIADDADNLYRYVGNNAPNLNDPSGMESRNLGWTAGQFTLSGDLSITPGTEGTFSFATPTASMVSGGAAFSNASIGAGGLSFSTSGGYTNPLFVNTPGGLHGGDDFGEIGAALWGLIKGIGQGIAGTPRAFKSGIEYLAGTAAEALLNTPVITATGGEHRLWTNAQAPSTSFFRTAGATTSWTGTLGAQREMYAASLNAMPFVPLGRPARIVAEVGVASASARIASSASATSSRRLPIISPHFTPDPQSYLQNAAEHYALKLSDQPSIALQVLSRREYIASTRSTVVAKMQFGNATERLVRDHVKDVDPMAGQFLIHIGGKNKVDFAGVGASTGRIFELTTPKAVAAHHRRYYGDLVDYVTYTRPNEFTLFPPLPR